LNKTNPALGQRHKELEKLFYLDAQVDDRDDECAYLGSFGGFVVKEASALLMAAPDMRAILDELEDSLDKQIYPEQAKEDFDAPDDREYTVTITAKQWRAIGRALSKATTVR
jgi:hypothetical protein